MRALIILIQLLLLGTGIWAQQNKQERKQLAAQFMHDMYKINKVYYNHASAAYSYDYLIYSDSLRTKLLKSFPVDVVRQGFKTYYKYLDAELLYDTSFSLIINHDDKQVQLLRSKQEGPDIGISSFIDTAEFHSMLKKTTHIAFHKKNRISTYSLSFNKTAQLSLMTISFDEKGMIRELSTCTHARESEEPQNETAEALPRSMIISLKSYSDQVKHHPALLISTYFKLFGNGRYVLSDSYQTFNLNNLYEKQDF